MTQNERIELRKQKNRESVKKHYREHREEILARQKKRREERRANATPEEREEMKKKNYERCTKYRLANKEKFKLYQRKYVKKLREEGKMPPTKQMRIDELEKQVEELKQQLDK